MSFSHSWKLGVQDQGISRFGAGEISLFILISVHFHGKSFNVTVIQVYAPTSNAEEVEVEWFYEDLKDLLELTPKNKDVLFIIGDWIAEVESQGTPGVTGKFGLGVQMEHGKG